MPGGGEAMLPMHAMFVNVPVWFVIAVTLITRCGAGVVRVVGKTVSPLGSGGTCRLRAKRGRYSLRRRYGATGAPPSRAVG